MADYGQVHPGTRAAWRQWLDTHHEQCRGIWLVQWRRATGRPRLTYDEAVEEALCFGWIDSLAKGLDGDREVILMTPRKPASGWSASNKARLERLTAAGLMAPAGLRAVEAAKASGAWTLLDDVEALVVPADLAAALAGNPAAEAAFTAMRPGAKKQILLALVTARKPETRARRIASAVEQAAAAAAAPAATGPLSRSTEPVDLSDC